MNTTPNQAINKIEHSTDRTNVKKNLDDLADTTPRQAKDITKEKLDDAADTSPKDVYRAAADKINDAADTTPREAWEKVKQVVTDAAEYVGEKLGITQDTTTTSVSDVKTDIGSSSYRSESLTDKASRKLDEAADTTPREAWEKTKDNLDKAADTTPREAADKLKYGSSDIGSSSTFSSSGFGSSGLGSSTYSSGLGSSTYSSDIGSSSYRSGEALTDKASRKLDEAADTTPREAWQSVKDSFNKAADTTPREAADKLKPEGGSFDTSSSYTKPSVDITEKDKSGVRETVILAQTTRDKNKL